MLETTSLEGKSHPCMFKNKYIITARIYTTTSTTASAKTDIKNNVV